MSLTHLPWRSPALIGRKCTRCFSSSAGRRDQDDILNILPGSRSPAQSHPSNVNSRPRQKLSAVRIGRESLTATKKREEEVEAFAKIEDFTKQMYRKWSPGDVYSPHDLSGAEQKKWKYGRTTPQSDAFDVLGVNPINEYKNFTMMSEFMTEMGRIKHSKLTGLRPVNQRKIAKAIRRAIGLGLMPSVHRHPLVLKKSSPIRFAS